MTGMKKTQFEVRITPPATVGGPSTYSLDYDGMILNPELYGDWVSAAYLLKGCTPAVDKIGNFAVWRQWSSGSAIHNNEVTPEKARELWDRINPESGVKAAVDLALTVTRQGADPHPVQLVVKVSYDKCDPKPITLFVEDSREHPIKITELNPNNNADMVKAVYCLKSKDICPKAFQVQADGFKLLERWHGQAEAQMPDLDLLAMWQSVLPAERFDDKLQASDVPGAILSSRSRIGTLLDEHTALAGTLFGANFEMTDEQGALVINQDSIIVDDLPKLQQRLADLFDELTKSQADQQLVLKARGVTVQDCHTLGLLSDDDMANHLADCLTVVLGKPVGAKAAKAVILDAVQSDGDTSAYVTRLAYSAVQKENDDLRLQCGGMQSTLDEAALQITYLKDLLAQINNAGSRWVFMDGLALQVQVALTPADEEQPE